jgi:aspartate/methionine/tyrosine aminotransferase
VRRDSGGHQSVRSDLGAKPLRDAIGADVLRRYGQHIEPDKQVTVCCGSTEAMISTLMAIVDPGDEVIVFEPFYENYGPDAILSGATPRFVRLRTPDWSCRSGGIEGGGSTTGPARSSSIRRTIRPARCSRAPS